MGVVICNFVASWKSKDGKIKRKDVRELIRMYENQEVHDNEIRNKAIDTFMIAIETHMKVVGNTRLEDIREIAEKLKGESNG